MSSDQVSKVFQMSPLAKAYIGDKIIDADNSTTRVSKILAGSEYLHKLKMRLTNGRRRFVSERRRYGGFAPLTGPETRTFIPHALLGLGLNQDL